MNISFVVLEEPCIGSGHLVCEVWDGSRFIGAIYPHADGVHIVSKHLNGTEPTPQHPHGVIVKLNGEAVPVTIKDSLKFHREMYKRRGVEAKLNGKGGRHHE